MYCVNIIKFETLTIFDWQQSRIKIFFVKFPRGFEDTNPTIEHLKIIKFQFFNI